MIWQDSMRGDQDHRVPRNNHIPVFVPASGIECDYIFRLPHCSDLYTGCHCLPYVSVEKKNPVRLVKEVTFGADDSHRFLELERLR